MTAVAQRLAKIRRRLEEGEHSALFIEELGWDHVQGSPSVTIDGHTMVEIAHKRGVGVWLGSTIPAGGEIRALDREVSRRTRERLLIFTDGTRQLWLWPEQRKSGSGFRLVQHHYLTGDGNEDLVQRLARASFTIDEEPTLTVLDVLERVRVTFGADKVTKKFYKDYKARHDQLVGLIEGIEDLSERNWYGSVLMTRLMFLYFIEKKGFLDNDPNYLRNRLKKVREAWGKDAFYGFYRRFLLPLFHEGLGSHHHDYSEDVRDLIGDVPYVNGGIFAPHLLETLHDIQVPDEAFEAIFDLFDAYRWHLDDRPSPDTASNEINPDVLGYIFEQYINQKEQGAYYTKEDVTGYMVGVTVLPAFLDKLDPPDGEPWALLAVEPDRYIYESVAHGTDRELPADIAAGLDDPDRRQRWDDKAPSEWGLPGETWWEVIDRRRHHADLRRRLANGLVTTSADAITYNLDLHTLVADYLDTLGNLDQVTHAFNTLRSLKILDPTSGSGAFLFAALETLADLYQILLDRARELAPDDSPPGFVAEAERHPNPTYYILKTAILNNLYGVDLMEEAGEIARLRLFLKLVSQINTRDELEPLPDLDFNIRTGNLLVGIAHLDDARERLAAQTNLFNYQQLEKVEEATASVAATYRAFIDAQAAASDPDKLNALKQQLVAEMNAQRDAVDRILYEIRDEQAGFEQWRRSHVPFHWFLEYPDVFHQGGFDVIVGNPPYVSVRVPKSSSQRRSERINKFGYHWVGYRTDLCPDIFTACVERALTLGTSSSWFSMILPISFQFSNDYTQARKVVRAALGPTWVSTFSRNPSALFSAGLGVRSTIVAGKRTDRNHSILVSRLHRWIEEYRPVLFDNVRYVELPEELTEYGWPRLASARLGELFRRLLALRSPIADLHDPRGSHEIRFKQIALYYISAFTEDPPAYDYDGNPVEQTGVSTIEVASANEGVLGAALLDTKLALAWWASTGDDFHVTKSGLLSTPIGWQHLDEGIRAELLALGRELLRALPDHVIYTRYARKWMGNYDLKPVRPITDRIDRLLLRELGLDEYWDEIQLFYATFMKATGERPGTIREAPGFD